MNFENLLKEVEKHSKLSRQEVLQKVDQKTEDLFGLVTQEAALHLVAKDLGMNLPSDERKPLQIKNIAAGVRNVSFVGRVFKISPIIEFAKQNGKGRVANLFIADNTGYVRIPLWNEQVSLVENEEIKVGDILQIAGGLSKENIYGDVEISVGRFGTINPAEGFFDIPVADELSRKYLSNMPQRAKISNLVSGNFEITGNIVQVFKGRFVFEHDGESAMVLSCVVDDGSGDVRIVFFRDLAEKLCGTRVSEMISIPEENRYEFVARKILGKLINVSGKVKKNAQFERLEMTASELKDLNPLDESKELVEEIELMLGG